MHSPLQAECGRLLETQVFPESNEVKMLTPLVAAASLVPSAEEVTINTSESALEAQVFPESDETQA
jgi:hypothetical protein